MIQHAIVIAALALALAGWVALQRWFSRADPGAPGAEERLRGCGGCDLACADGGGDCERPSRRLGASLGVLVVFALIGVGLGTGLFQACRGGAVSPPPRSPASSQKLVKHHAAIMSTRVELTAPARVGDRAASEVFRIFRSVERRMNEWKPSSPLGAVNRAAGGSATPVPADLRALVQRGVALGALTGGAFDVTWAGLWGLWDFRAARPAPPAAAAVRARQALVDYRRVAIDDRRGTIRLARPGMKIGLGGIAKGYAIDRAVARLREMGVRHFLLTAGGQVWAEGRRGERRWRVGIRHPRRGPGDYFTHLELSGRCVSTSGDYERYFVHGGKRFHHILDPRTGWPARGLQSASVVDTDATRADALSTALMVMGREKGLALIRGLPGVEVVVVDRNGRVHATKGLGIRPGVAP